VVFVTHEHDIAYHTRRIVHLRDGLLSADEPVPPEQQLVARAVHEAAVAA
jgi:hypothetical protein